MNEKQEKIISQYRAYIAGLMDTNATMTVQVHPDDDYTLGYGLPVVVRVTRQWPFSLQAIQSYCREMSYQCKVVEYNGGYQFRMERRMYVKDFIRDIKPFLRDRIEEAELLLKIIEDIDDGKHKTHQGFISIVGDIEDLRSMHSGGREAKYTVEYFENEWSEEL